MEQEVYTVVGYQYGRYEANSGPDQGKMKYYANLFVTQEISGEPSNDYGFTGCKALKFKCASPDLVKPLVVGDEVNLYFDGNTKFPKVVFINPVK